MTTPLEVPNTVPDTTPDSWLQRKAVMISGLIALVVIVLWVGLWFTLEYMFPGWGLLTIFVLLFFVLWGVIYKYSPFSRSTSPS